MLFQGRRQIKDRHTILLCSGSLF